MTTIIIVVVLVLLALWVIKTQNLLVRLDELCKNALKQINVQQVSRYDAISALVKLTREYASYEGDALEKIVKSRRITASAAPTVDEINQNEAALSAVSAKLIAVAEQYPDLKANQQYSKTMDEITRYEENVRLSRMTFNDTVTKFNQAARMFPGSIVASMLHFPPKDYLAEDTKKADYPEI